MFAAPRIEAVESFLSSWEDDDGSSMALMTEVVLPMKTSRRRPLGQHPAFLVDVPWSAHLDPAAADALAELSAGAIPEAALDAGPETSVLHRLLAVQTALREDFGLPTFGCCDSRFGNRRQREKCWGSGVCGPRGFPPPTVPTRGCGRCGYCQRSSRVGTEHRRSLFELDAGVCESQGAFRRPSAAFLHGHVVCSRLAVGPHSRECSATSLGQPRSDVLRTGRPRRGSLPAGMDVDRPPTSGLPFAVPASPEVARAALCNLGQADLGSRLHLVPEGDELPRKPGDRSPGFRRSNRQWRPRGGRRSSEAPSTTFEGKGKGSGPVNPMSPLFAATRSPGVFSKLVSSTGKVLNLPCRRRPGFRPRRVWISGQVCSRVSGGSSALEDPFVDVPLGAGHVQARPPASQSVHGFQKCRYAKPSAPADFTPAEARSSSPPTFDVTKSSSSALMWLDFLFESVVGALTGFGQFVRASLALVSHTAQVAKPSTDLWPCPPPLSWRWTGPPQVLESAELYDTLSQCGACCSLPCVP